ncbi:response regulator [Herpetosiphon sp. NSE202]|uniref:response regulator n=1 Tax=Herpetosiphon sp. NSE202 TaxID=3351349 RepID=UPI0036426E6B
MMIRILLADDHAVVRAGLRALIDNEHDMVVVGEAASGSEVVPLAQRLNPTIVLTDIAMPEMNGMQITSSVLDDNPAIRVLALSAYEDRSYLRELIRRGASGYVLKRAASETLIQAIRAIAIGGLYFDPALTRYLTSTETSSSMNHYPDEVTLLSDRETAVLQLIAQGYTNKEIAAQLDLSVKTVETYKMRGMEKLNLNSRVDLVRYALLIGWLQTKETMSG